MISLPINSKDEHSQSTKAVVSWDLTIYDKSPGEKPTMYGDVSLQAYQSEDL